MYGRDSAASRITCAECGTSGIAGRSHYPNNDPEDGPAHTVVDVRGLEKALAGRITKNPSSDRALALAADIIAAGEYGGLPEIKVRKLLRHLAHAARTDYMRLRKRAARRVLQRLGAAR